MTSNFRPQSFGFLFHITALSVLSFGASGGFVTGAEPPDSGPRYDAVNPEPANRSTELSAELQAIQRSLGGPAVDRFPSLRGDSGALQMQGRLRAALEQRTAHHGVHRDAVRALRDAATQLDMSANRLESLELYAQADALRELAQRMRVDARNSSGAIQGEPSSPSPASWTEPAPMGKKTRVMPQPHWNNSMPQLQPPSPEPDIRIAPRSPAAPGLSDASPPLEPVPQPENRDDRPKPQPLMDSPQAEPKPDVEVEG